MRRPHPWFRLVMVYAAFEALAAAAILMTIDVTSPRLAAVFDLAPQPVWAIGFSGAAMVLGAGIVWPAVGKLGLAALTAIWGGWIGGYALFFWFAPTSPLFLMIGVFLVLAHLVLILCPEAGLWTPRL